MAPGEHRDLARPEISAATGLSLEPQLNQERADLLGAVVAYLRHRGQWEVAANDIEPFGLHQPVLGEVLDDQVHEMDLRCRVGRTGQELGERLGCRGEVESDE